MPGSRTSSARTPLISVVIPTLGGYESLDRVLGGYARQSVMMERFEVVVVADRAEPDLAAVQAGVGERPFAVSLLTGVIPGASGNRNVGWHAARAPLVLFTDNDTVPVPVMVAEHLASHAAHQEMSTAVAGHVRWARGQAVTPFMKWLDSGWQFDFGSVEGTAGSWTHLYTANASVKRALLERVGGYDEVRLPYLYEDLDWAYRARPHGLRVVYNRAAVVDHWRVVTPDTWKARAPLLAVAERTFTDLHPELTPWFFTRFSQAAQTPPGRGRAARLARVVPRRLPWAGRVVWERAGLHWMQELAPPFMAAWNRADSGGPIADSVAPPDRS